MRVACSVLREQLRHVVEKLLPAKWWKKPVAVTEEQFWLALASPENPQTKSVLHVAEDKFISYMQSAAGLGTAEERLRHLDRAMAVADFMTEVDTLMGRAKDEVKRREAARQEKGRQR